MDNEKMKISHLIVFSQLIGQKNLRYFRGYMFMKGINIAMFAMLSFFIMLVPLTESGNSGAVTFTTYYPDGSVETFVRDVRFLAGNSVAECITHECRELIARDPWIQQYVNSEVGLYFIISAGKGLHFSLPPSLLQSSFFEIIFSLFPSITYCSYSGTAAETDIIPIGSPSNETLIQGEHRILCIGFVGIVGWQGIFSYEDTGFAGFSPFVWTSETTNILEDNS